MKSDSRLKRAGKKILIAAGIMAAVLVLFLVGTFTFNLIKTKAEAGHIEPYGQLVPVDGKKMNVLIEGDGEDVVVLLPGFGTGAPALDFELLIDELSPHYKVVTVEPFGYGLSDKTDKERTSANIVNEIHEALQQLNLDRYTLMGHSIAGIYGLEYVNQYPDEVEAFVGIDSSVPTQPGMDAKFPLKSLAFLKQSGLLRLAIGLSGDPYDGLAFDDQTKEQMGLIAVRNTNSSTTLNEMKHIYTNFKEARRLTFPSNLPLLLFVVGSDPSVEGWIPLHEEQVRGSAHGEVILLEGDHYLHHTRSKEIAEGFRAFMNEAQ